MQKVPRLAEVAKLAEVSPGLVSRILNNDPNLKIRKETRDRVMSAIEMLQYKPNISARALRSARTGLLGFALHHVNDPIYTEMVNIAQTTAAAQDYSIVLVNADDLSRRNDAFRELIQGQRVDGLLIQSGFSERNYASTLQDLARSMPSVVFNADEAEGIRSLRLDDISAASIATEHLISLGHTKISFVGASGAAAERRYLGYIETLKSHRLPPQPKIIGGWEADEAHEAIKNYFAQGGSSSAFVVVTSTSALGVHSGVVATNLSIPNDVSIVSLHDTWFAPHLNPPLTVVEMPLSKIGSLAVELLIQQINTPQSGETILKDPAPRLVERGSTAHT